MITINPSDPSTDDSIELVFSSIACPIGVNTRNISGSEYEFTLADGSACDFSPLPLLSYSWNIGRVPEGTYTVTFSQNTPAGGIAPIDMIEFTVSEGALPFPSALTSAVPTMSAPSLFLLAFVVAFVAYRRISRR